MGTIERVTTPKTRKTSYLVRYSYTDAFGRRVHRKRRFRLKKEAEAWLSQQEADLSRGVYFEPSREAFGIFIDRWAAELGPPRSGATILAYRQHVRLRFGALRDIRLCDLNARHIDVMVQGWRTGKRAVSETTCAEAFMVLKMALGDAVRWQLIVRNPCDLATRPKRGAVERLVWTEAQARTVLAQVMGTDDELLVRLAFATLARAGELAALRWDDIDVAGKAVTISRTWTKTAEGKPLMGTGPKTAAGVRTIPLPDEVIALVRARRGIGPIFVTARGRQMGPTDLARVMRRIADEAAVPQIGIHGIRRTGATLLARAGVPVKTVSSLLGHAGVGITLQVYTQPSAEDRAVAAEALSVVMTGSLRPNRVQIDGMEEKPAEISG